MDVSPSKGFSQLFDSINGDIMNGTLRAYKRS